MTVDLFDADAVADAVVGSEAVVHLATNVPEMSKAARPKGWETHNRLRVDATRNLVAAARATGAARFVKESITFVYATVATPGSTRTRRCSPTSGCWPRRSRASASRSSSPPTAGPRPCCGSGCSTAVPATVGRTRTSASRGGDARQIAGDAGNYMSSIHCDDVATAVVAALSVPTGVYNVIDDEPLTRGEYLAAFGAAFGVKPPKPTPARLVKLMGGAGAEGLLASQRVSNRRFRDASGWAPAYRDARVGWAAVAARGEEG